MGKYIRKSKTLMDVSSSSASSSPLGVRTRAMKKSSSMGGGSAAGGGGGGDGGSYLQLRSRRLEKREPFGGKGRKCPLKVKNLQNSVKKDQGHSWNSGFVEGEEKKEDTKNEVNNGGGDGGVDEASCGENLLEFDRTTREGTPCSLIRDPDSILTPGSSTKPNNARDANGGVPNSAQRNIPTPHDMNDFFAGPEEKQKKEFIEKYNFDPVNDKPLPGRYEWVKIDN